jgi:phospholipid/cholesterol/gamma-HCH transport system substrate-binding protein
VRNAEAKVGLFVVASALVLGVAVYYVSNARFGENQVPYTVYLRYAGGLEPGTQVLFGGMSVGQVTALRPDPGDPTRIEISLTVRRGTPINAKSLAKLESTTLMSNPVVSISTGTNEAPRLPGGAVIPSQEPISMDEMERKVAALADTAQVTLSSVRTDVNKLTGDAQLLLANLNRVTDKTNQKHVAAILSNADATVAQLSSKIGPTVDNLNTTVANVNTTVSNANGTISTLRGPMQADLIELHRTLEETHNLIGNLQSLVWANSQNISDSLENIRMATDNLNDLTESVKERPWSLVRIRQPKGRKVPQGQIK